MEKGEQSRKDFIRLAQKRVTRALHTIQLIGNLSNKSNYSYTEREVDKIFSTLQSEIDECRKKFNAKQKSKTQFTLEDTEEDEFSALD